MVQCAKDHYGVNMEFIGKREVHEKQNSITIVADTSDIYCKPYNPFSAG